MRVVASDLATDLIAQQGGRLYVWLKSSHCCGAVTTLACSSVAPARRTFERVEAGQRFDLFVDAGLRRLPDELQFEVRRFPRRVEAYWNGCAWVI